MAQDSHGERNFRLLVLGRGLSSIGDNVVTVALAFAVLDLTGSVKDLGIVLAARAVPLALFLVAAGVWADRVPRRSLMITADLARAAAQVGSGLLVLSSARTIWGIAALQFVYGTGSAFFIPASIALVPETVAPKAIQRANSMLSISENIASVGGPALAGVIVVAIGAGWGLIVDAASFLTSALLLAAMHLKIRVATGPSSRTRDDLREGWRSFTSRQWLRVTVPGFMVVNALSFGPLFVLGPAVAKSSYNGAATWALLFTFLGVGAVLGGVAGTRISPRYPLRLTLGLSVIGTPALLVGLALRAPTPILVAAALLAGADLALFNLMWFTVVQKLIPPAELSRVSSWDALGSFVATPVGYAIAGPVAIAVGTQATLIGAAAVFIATTVAVLSFSSVRNLTTVNAAAAQSA